MAESADISHGITIAFGTSSFSAQITDVTPPGLTRDSVDTSYQATSGAKTHIPVDLYESGELSFKIQFLAGTNPPIDGAAETITITFPSGTTWVFTGFMVAYEPDAPHLDLMTAQVRVKVSGTIVIDSEGAGEGDASVEV